MYSISLASISYDHILWACVFGTPLLFIRGNGWRDWRSWMLTAISTWRCTDIYKFIDSVFIQMPFQRRHIMNYGGRERGLNIENGENSTGKCWNDVYFLPLCDIVHIKANVFIHHAEEFSKVTMPNNFKARPSAALLVKLKKGHPIPLVDNSITEGRTNTRVYIPS